MTTAALDPLSAADFGPGAFTADALLAYWDGDGDETAPRATARGRDEIEAALARWVEPETLVTVRDADDCFVEGTFMDRERDRRATFVAALQLTGDGTIARCLSFHSPLVEPPPVREPASTLPAGSARLVLGHYFACLTAGEFAKTVECFSEDCLYSHPPYSPGAERAEFRGRAELLNGFETVRGARPLRLPDITSCVQNGTDCFIEGVVDGDPPRGSFVSSVSLHSDGLIRRYVAFYTEARVPRL